MLRRERRVKAGYQRSTMGSDYELHLTIKGQTYKLDGFFVHNGKSYISKSKFTFKDAWEEAYRREYFEAHPKATSAENPYQLLKSFRAKGKANPQTSFHYKFLDDKVLPQFERYSKLAKEYSIDGVAFITNTDFMWQTFNQATEYLENVEVFLQELDVELGKGLTAQTSRLRAKAAKAR